MFELLTTRGKIFVKWDYSWIPQCSCSISHDATFRTEMCAFLFWMVHCVIWNKCIVGFIILVYSVLTDSIPMCGSCIFDTTEPVNQWTLRVKQYLTPCPLDKISIIFRWYFQNDFLIKKLFQIMASLQIDDKPLSEHKVTKFYITIPSIATIHL